NSVEFKLPGEQPEKQSINSSTNIPELVSQFIQRFSYNKESHKELDFAQGLYGYTNFEAVQFFDTVQLQSPQTYPFP
ncbi:hypothetical protein, partial [Escherichia coli]|uniref:hypothetical protein n=1 Tax=Escherichia coli TaxID=562 RepID=UPI003CE7E8C3